MLRFGAAAGPDGTGAGFGAKDTDRAGLSLRPAFVRIPHTAGGPAPFALLWWPAFHGAEVETAFSKNAVQKMQ